MPRDRAWTKKHIREVPDFPKPGSCSTISPPCLPIRLLEGNRGATEIHRRQLQARRTGRIESRGFLVAAPLAFELGLGFHMVRKKGKLPGKTIPYTYDLEYGTDTIEVQDGAIEPGQRLVILDDLLATGGTLAAAIELVRKVGGELSVPPASWNSPS